ncbi:hypothetical protein A1Q1_02429 [Trichosporon asahii var. asahii CBS 2479]|uniref:Uncharacterized protein n=1 Tax=Trichosporon asahii var. asahii (strain ATCC 90039 / CBS 2479 / JCM 2466 / KCTC 7840 / NBRC 103889/ NCYC 2677 / UAMH 7654) TaxID=1186058 RepID=J5T0N3_TRIAS|nr:hypothetical protein A1Q1_02429 [Trichosporon asahii var. asahii CBS 2479]EJT48521.1 hypothetical protein A1Q1_02429 [Trichosporon asahii var. asahii CBS 2479]
MREDTPAQAVTAAVNDDLISRPAYAKLLARLVNDCNARLDASVAIAVAAAMAKCHEEVDNRLSHALATAEERHETHTATLVKQLANTQSIVNAQTAQIETLSALLKVAHPRLEGASLPADATALVDAAEARFSMALNAAESRFNEALTTVKVDTAQQLQAVRNFSSVSLQELQDSIHQSALSAATTTFLSDVTPQARVATAEDGINHVRQGNGAYSQNNEESERDQKEVSDRLLANELACNKAIKEYQQLSKRVQALGTNAGRNNVSIMKAQQTLGERLRLLEETVSASNSERVGAVNGLRTEIQELRCAMEELASSPPTDQYAPSRTASTDSPIALVLDKVLELVGKHEAFFEFYGDRLIAVTLALAGGKISRLSPTGIKGVQATLRQVKHLSPLKIGDVAQHYIDRLERKRNAAARGKGEFVTTARNAGSDAKQTVAEQANEADEDGAENILLAEQDRGAADQVAEEGGSIGKSGCEVLQ